MNYVKHIPVMAIMSLIYWLAFAQQYTFFICISWLFMIFAIIGLFIDECKEFMKDYDLKMFLMGLPFGIFNLYTMMTYDTSHIFTIVYVFMLLINYAFMFHIKSEA